MVDLDKIFGYGELLEGEELELRLDSDPDTQAHAVPGAIEDVTSHASVHLGRTATDRASRMNFAPQEFVSDGTHNDDPALRGGYGS